LLPQNIHGQVVGDYRSTGSTAWNLISIWVIWNGTKLTFTNNHSLNNANLTIKNAPTSTVNSILTNSSRFTALPAGRFLYAFHDLHVVCSWWSTEASLVNFPGNYWARVLQSAAVDVHRNDYNKSYGLSVRCVKD
jgi:uncharacterized protein (TIGR02145 family)